jgi:hypothetical protein
MTLSTRGQRFRAFAIKGLGVDVKDFARLAVALWVGAVVKLSA